MQQDSEAEAMEFLLETLHASYMGTLLIFSWCLAIERDASLAPPLLLLIFLASSYGSCLAANGCRESKRF